MMFQIEEHHLPAVDSSWAEGLMEWERTLNKHTTSKELLKENSFQNTCCGAHWLEIHRQGFLWAIWKWIAELQDPCFNALLQ